MPNLKGPEKEGNAERTTQSREKASSLTDLFLITSEL
jgi:hypothetical protein